MSYCADKAVGARCKLQVLLTEVQQSFLRLSTEEQDVDANLMVPGTPVLYVDGDAPAVPGIITTMQTVRQGAVEIILHDILLQQFKVPLLNPAPALTLRWPNGL